MKDIRETTEDLAKDKKDLKDTKDFMSICEDLFKNVVAQESAKLAIRGLVLQ